MKRFGIVLLGVALAFGQPVSAQEYAPDLQHGSNFQYTFSEGSGQAATWGGVQVGPYMGKVGHVAWNSPTAPSFTLYCVDYANRISRGNQINAYVSTIGTGQIGMTRLGQAVAPKALDRYKMAAWLASQYHGAGAAHWSAIQTTIWTITALSPFSAGNPANWTGPDGTNWSDEVIAALNADFYGMNFDNWHVLTPVDDNGRLVAKQEMLAQSVVPEPQTYVLLASGLLFMVFFGRRRMKEQGYL
jgi:hypothetical protein